MTERVDEAQALAWNIVNLDLWSDRRAFVRDALAAAEQRGADRMARAMVAALYWRAGEYLLRARELGASGLDGAAHHLYTRRTAIVVAASHLEQHL